MGCEVWVVSCGFESWKVRKLGSWEVGKSRKSESWEVRKSESWEVGKLGYTGAVFREFFGNAVGISLSFLGLVVWIIVPLLISLRKFKGKDL